MNKKMSAENIKIPESFTSRGFFYDDFFVGLNIIPQ